MHEIKSFALSKLHINKYDEGVINGWTVLCIMTWYVKPPHLICTVNVTFVVNAMHTLQQGHIYSPLRMDSLKNTLTILEQTNIFEMQRFKKTKHM